MNKKDHKIRLETKEDCKEVENVTREAFWNVYRHGCLEHYVFTSLPEYKRKGYDKKLLDYSVKNVKEMGVGCIMYRRKY